MTISIRPPEDVPDGTPMSVSSRSTAELATGNWRTFRPEYVTRPSPCNLDCPAGTDVRAFLRHAAAGDAAAAWRTILAHNPLPATCGRVCYHPCETRCNRVGYDEGIAVHAIERAVAAEGRRRAEQDIVSSAGASGGRIAIVGSGPAGLSCAYHAARRGHQPVVFEAMPEPGGMLRYGIPDYRLPRTVLREELDLLSRLGVTFRNNARLGATLTWDELRSFDAVFLAVGTQQSRAAAVPGEDLVGVSPALDMLRRVNAGEKVHLVGPVVIIGGGNTAIDAARVALRLGAQPTVVYRRTREEMPAHPDEIAQAEAEGVTFVFQAAPLRFQGWRGVLTSLHCQRTRPGPPDASGRRSPEPIPGETLTLPCRTALTAIGEELEQQAFADTMAVVRGRLQADRWGRTSDPLVFAGGDAATGAGTVVEAIGSGRRAAEAIDFRLKPEATGLGEDPRSFRVQAEDAADDVVRVPGLNLFYFQRAKRAPLPMLHRETAIAGFHEVNTGLSWEEAIDEARRCFTCGECTECGNCAVFCPDAAVSRAPNGAYVVDYVHCKGCGICVAECPRGSMTLVSEVTR